MEKVKMSPPWMTYYRELYELFKDDKDVYTFMFDEVTNTITIGMKKYEKVKALKRVLPAEKEFGGVKVKLDIQYESSDIGVFEAYKILMRDNPVFKYAYSFPTQTNPVNYVVFKKEVAQFWNDDMSDPHGVTSALYEDLARDVFVDDGGVIFSTDSEQDLVPPDESKPVYDPSKHKATPEEVEQWDKYNGEGSFYSGEPVKGCADEPVKVTDKEVFESIFDYDCPCDKCDDCSCDMKK